MSYLRKVVHQQFRICCNRLICDLIKQVRDSLFGSPHFKLLLKGLLDILGQPYNPLSPAISQEELLARKKVSANTHKTRRLNPSADCPGNC